MRDDIYASWSAGHRNVLAVAPTGAGKTALISDIHSRLAYPSAPIAHRQELVVQLSCALAAMEIYHRVIASESVVKFCIQQHVQKFGKNFIHSSAPVAASSVQTLVRRVDQLKTWLPKVQLWTIDEAHHVQVANTWGKAVALFPNAYGLGVTATATRTDRKSLAAVGPTGKPSTGVFHDLVQGPTPRELITMGFLTPYRIWAPTQSIDLAQVAISQATGEFNQHALRKAAHKSQVTGDIVDHYLKIAPGKRGLSFLTDVEQAKETAQRYMLKGVPAAAISAKTPDRERQMAVDALGRGELLQLCNVDLFGEGFDVPKVEVVSCGRPTWSLGFFLQMFGRMMRPAEGKTHGLYIDHVGNLDRHGLPDAPRQWSLHGDAPRSKRHPKDLPIPTYTCEECFSVWEALSRTCPYCGWYMEPESRAGPQYVDGNLVELDEATLAAMRGEVNKIETTDPAIPYGADEATVGAKWKHHRQRLAALTELRDCINLWAGIQNQVHDRSDGEAYTLFYHRYGVDVITAQTLSRADMVKLTELIRKEFY